MRRLQRQQNYDLVLFFVFLLMHISIFLVVVLLQEDTRRFLMRGEDCFHLSD